MKRKIVLLLICAVMVMAAAASSASAEWDWGKGSFNKEDGFERRYVPPLTNGLFNESPFITTEISMWYWYQKIPDDSITAGGQINLGAIQARLALTDRLALIATKDGFADIHFGSTLADVDGFANIAAGLKYAIYQDKEKNEIVTVGGRYEIPIGNIDTSGVSLQGHGDGFIDLFVSGAKHWDKFGLQGSAGTNLALDQANNTSQLHYSVHMDYELMEGFFPVIEFNGITPISDGDRVALGIEGHDVLNLGSNGVGTTLTLAGGARYMITENVQIGAAYEKTVSAREDLFDNRFSANLLFHF